MLRPKIGTIYIDGYWIDDPTQTFTNYECRFGIDWNEGDDEDENVFYYFEDGELTPGACGDFYMTAWRQDDSQ